MHSAGSSRSPYTALCRHSPSWALPRSSFPKAAIGGIVQHDLAGQSR